MVDLTFAIIYFADPVQGRVPNNSIQFRLLKCKLNIAEPVKKPARVHK
jgi:hypothetical protein